MGIRTPQFLAKGVAGKCTLAVRVSQHGDASERDDVISSFICDVGDR